MRYLESMKHYFAAFLWACMVPAFTMQAQAWREGDVHGKIKLGKGLGYSVEAQATQSNGQTPLWLNANKHGLSSLEKTNGYLLAGIERPLTTDSVRRWGVGYGLNVALTQGFTSRMVVDQAFVQARWLYATLTIGSKRHNMELKNNALSSGSQLLGINARPVPQVRLALPDYWTLPFGNGWLHLKGHVAYGKTTDDNWQKRFTGQQHLYTENVLYHSKAGYFMIGNPERFAPLSLELGLEMASTFGGTSYELLDDGTVRIIRGRTGLKSFVKAFLPGGADVGETTYQNAEGNQLGAWLARVNYDADTWRFAVYADKYFEDHSSMLQLDYDGYGTGDEWLQKKKRRFFVYDLKDWMLGAELNFKYGRWITDVVLEYLYTKYQSGPIYHDHTNTIADHLGGQDNYYNHYIYTGWQHWGQVMGNPLYRSPIYNTNGNINVANNRFVAWHLGIGGKPTDELSYRFLATYQNGLGTYADPFDKKEHNVSLMLEGKYELRNDWNVAAAVGADMGRILGNKWGVQLTVAKKGLFK